MPKHTKSSGDNLNIKDADFVGNMNLEDINYNHCRHCGIVLLNLPFV